MKIKTTQAKLKENFHAVLSIGYCNLQWLLYYKAPIAYTAGKYGWNADIYDMGNGFAICTGYRPFGMKVPYEIVEKYDKAAHVIVEDARYGVATSYKDVEGLSLPDSKRKAAEVVLDQMIEAFLKEAVSK